jgi:hypothetical protein
MAIFTQFPSLMVQMPVSAFVTNPTAISFFKNNPLALDRGFVAFHVALILCIILY